MNLSNRIQELSKRLKIDDKKNELSELKIQLSDPNLWKQENLASQISLKVTQLEKEIQTWQNLYDLSLLASDYELAELVPEVEKLEQETYYTGPHDHENAIISIYSGAGGVDAQDWAAMLLKMYLKYAENHGFHTEVIQSTEGNEAGIKNATIVVSGERAFAKLQGENGVHRLVRLSPYNAKNLRQTSFALVEVIPELVMSKQIEISDSDLKIDVFRSGGHGGQSVNTTDSAVRITHLPSGIVVTCQNQRSQLQNKTMALNVLKSRLADRLEKENKESINELRGEIASNEWGSQIRSYVMHPYKMVKDHRTEVETSNIDKVLNGELEEFVSGYLKYSMNK